MADTKISALTAYGTQHGDDLIAVVDVHDTAMAVSGTDKAATTYKVFGSPSAAGQLVYWNGTATGVPAGAANLTVGASGQLNFTAITDPVSPVDGDEWYSGGQKCRVHYNAGNKLYRDGLLYAQNADLTLSVPSAASLISTTGALGTNDPGTGWLNVANRTVRITAGGYMTTSTVSGGTTFFLQLGTTVVGTTLSLGVGANHATIPWWLDILLTVKATGATGKVEVTGLAMANAAAIGQFSNGTTVGTQAPGTQSTVDLTADQAIVPGVTCSSAGNSVTVTHLIIEVKG